MKSKMNLWLLDVLKANTGDYGKRKGVGTELLSGTGNGMIRPPCGRNRFPTLFWELRDLRIWPFLDHLGCWRMRALFHESLLSTSGTTCAAAEVCTTAWRKYPPHVPRNLCARASQLSLYCSMRHTQHLRCLKDREAVDDP